MECNPILYLVSDSSLYTKEEFLSRIEDACRAGIGLLQLREKEKEGKELLELAFEVKKIADKYDVDFVVDDRLDIALIVGCGVHLGQKDIPIKYAREILGAEKTVGATAKTVEQAKTAQEQGADYVGVGAIYPTTTKVKTVITKVETLNEICETVDIPVFAIGGLNKDNIDILKDSKISGICVVSAIMKEEDSYKATKELKEEVLKILS